MKRPRTRPHVSINMAMSADGKISTYRRETFPLGSREDRRLMDVLRARADAVVIGARTLHLDGWAIRVRDAAIRRRRVQRGRPPHPLNVVLSTRLDVALKREFFVHRETEKLVVTTSQATKSRVRRIGQYAEVLVLPRKRIRPRHVLDALAGRDVRRVLVEGGGELNFSFLRERLVDEIYLTVTPRILGGHTSPTPVDGNGFLRDAQIPLELVSSRRISNEVFLRYRVLSD